MMENSIYTLLSLSLYPIKFTRKTKGNLDKIRDMELISMQISSFEWKTIKQVNGDRISNV